MSTLRKILAAIGVMLLAVLGGVLLGRRQQKQEAQAAHDRAQHQADMAAQAVDSQIEAMTDDEVRAAARARLRRNGGA